MDFPLLQTLVRLLVPLLILRFPIPGIVLAMMVDMYDWQVMQHTTAAQTTFYQNWDKALDVYYQLFILSLVFHFKDTIAKKVAIILFSYRLLGLLIFVITQSRYVLVFFPNLFENFVLFYLVYIFSTKKKRLFTSQKVLFLILPFLIVPKLIHEYFQHILIKQPWEIYNVGALLGTTGIIEEYINYLSWGGLLYLIPASIVLLLVISWKK